MIQCTKPRAKLCNIELISFFVKVENSHQSNDGKMRDFCDGEYYQQHELYSVDETALQIFLYYDDFEVCNPLGSRVKKQKIGTCTIFSISIALGG